MAYSIMHGEMSLAKFSTISVLAKQTVLDEIYPQICMLLDVLRRAYVKMG